MADNTMDESALANSAIIEVRVGELRQLFNSIDPAPFRERDLDPKVESFIVDWSQEVPPHRPLSFVVRMDGPAPPTDEGELLREAVHQFFTNRAETYRRKLRHLFHVGRISLLIGLVALAIFSTLGQLVEGWVGGGLGKMLHESLLIGGWVAMWRPLQVFLYDWWPIRADARLSDRLAAMPVSIRYRA